MPDIEIFAIRQIMLDAATFTHVKIPESGFHVVLNPDQALSALLEIPTIRQKIDSAAAESYQIFLQHTARHLRDFDKLFAGMIKHGAAPNAVADQAGNLKSALENQTGKWERNAANKAMKLLNQLAQG